jgi:hypothetical protein
MEKRPRLGAVIMRNLAIDLGEKLRDVHRLLAESYGCQASTDSADSTLKSP